MINWRNNCWPTNIVTAEDATLGIALRNIRLQYVIVALPGHPSLFCWCVSVVVLVVFIVLSISCHSTHIRYFEGFVFCDWGLSVITKTRLFKYIEKYTTKNWKFLDKVSDIFHISAQNIDCGYSLEPPRRQSISICDNSVSWKAMWTK